MNPEDRKTYDAKFALVAIGVAVLVMLLAVIMALTSGCMSNRTDSVVNIYGNPADVQATESGGQSVIVNVTGTQSKPVEVSTANARASATGNGFGDAALKLLPQAGAAIGAGLGGPGGAVLGVSSTQAIEGAVTSLFGGGAAEPDIATDTGEITITPQTE